jgi:hypothetical protein
MAKVYTGRDGRLLLAGSTLVKVSNWSLQADLETLETTSLGDFARSYTPGIQSFSGSATLLYYKSDTGVNDAATLLRKVVNTTGVASTDTVQLTLRLNDGDVNDDVTFSAYITSASFGASVGEVTSAQISFQGTGALTTAAI